MHFTFPHVVFLNVGFSSTGNKTTCSNIFVEEPDFPTTKVPLDKDPEYTTDSFIMLLTIPSPDAEVEDAFPIQYQVLGENMLMFALNILLFWFSSRCK